MMIGVLKQFLLQQSCTTFVVSTSCGQTAALAPGIETFDIMGLRRGKVFAVFVSNLPLNIKKADLQALFKGCGPIESVYICHQNPDMKYLYGFVRYKTWAGAEKAVKELAGWPVMGNRIRVEITKEMQEDIYQKDGVMVGRYGSRRATPDDDLNMQMVLKCIEEINEKATHDSERVSTTMMLEAISKETNCLVPMHTPKETPITMDFSKLDQLMEEELKKSSS